MKTRDLTAAEVKAFIDASGVPKDYKTDDLYMVINDAYKLGAAKNLNPRLHYESYFSRIETIMEIMFQVANGLIYGPFEIKKEEFEAMSYELLDQLHDSVKELKDELGA